ncbi:MAG: hypothetical protein PHX38_00700 [Sulfuricella sp.]|nr:hypothetical protein [Sulfuricella sp.]
MKRWTFPTRNSASTWLLLAWDIPGLRAVVAECGSGGLKVVGEAFSGKADFSAAARDVAAAFAGQGIKLPAKAALASRLVSPVVAELPVAPGKPRPAGQMRELLRPDLETAQAEFSNLWNFGALLAARGHLSADDRARVGMEDELRRENATPLRFGETAMHLGLIGRPAMDECLYLQERLQLLDGDLAIAWNGHASDGQPTWLGCAANAGYYQAWTSALDENGIRLAATLPLAWLAGDAAEGGDAARVSLELHHEEVVAVLRRGGRVVAARAEGRMERPLRGDWLARLAGDWETGGRARLDLLCLYPADEDAAAAVVDELETLAGSPVTLTRADACWQGLWRGLADEADAPSQSARLPRLAEREMREPLLANADFRRTLAVAGVLALLGGIEAAQQVAAMRLEKSAAAKLSQEKNRTQSTQQQLHFNAELEALAKDLDKTRSELAPLLNDRQRLSSIAAMRRHLPDLIQTLARAVGDDAVLESLHNSRSANDATSIKVTAWSPSYSGAQAFANRMAEFSGALGYGVSQTEIVASKGRSDKPGHTVTFWLLPDQDELEAAKS